MPRTPETVVEVVSAAARASQPPRWAAGTAVDLAGRCQGTRRVDRRDARDRGQQLEHHVLELEREFRARRQEVDGRQAHGQSLPAANEVRPERGMSTICATSGYGTDSGVDGALSTSYCRRA